MVWWGGQGWEVASGRVPGAQTIARAELTALVWAVEAAPAGLRVYSDCQYVVRGVRTVTRGTAEHLLEGRHGDLWQRVLGRDLRASWTPAHRRPEDVPTSEVTAWVANRLADAAAKREARAVRPPPALRRRREASLVELEHTHTVLAQVEYDRRALADHGRLICPRLHYAAHAAVHQFDPAPGVFAPPGRAGALPAGPVPWPALCRRCGLVVRGTAQWQARLAQGCHGSVAVRRCTNDVGPAPGGHVCRRCALPIRPDRVRVAAGNRCPVPEADPDDATFHAAFRHERDRLLQWRKHMAPAASPDSGPAPAGQSPAEGFLPAWRGHLLLRAQGTGRPASSAASELGSSAFAAARPPRHRRGRHGAASR